MAEKQLRCTRQELEDLKKELSDCKNVRREEIKKEIATARSYGDLSENSEYDEAKNDQAKNEARIVELEGMINRAIVVDENNIDHSTANIGTIVTVFNETRKKESVYQLVGSFGADPLNGKISISSPIGKALTGHREGDVVVAETPSGIMNIRIIKIERADLG